MRVVYTFKSMHIVPIRHYSYTLVPCLEYIIFSFETREQSSNINMKVQSDLEVNPVY
jgi:hypothetical protein